MITHDLVRSRRGAAFVVLLLVFGATSWGAEPSRVTTSVRVFDEDGRRYVDVQVSNDGKEAIEVHKSPSSVNFFDRTHGASWFDSRTGAGEGHFESYGIMFREDRAKIVLRSGERFGKRIDITDRLTLKAAEYSVTADWNLDKGVPTARQATFLVR